MKFLRENESIVAIKLDEFEFCVIDKPILIVKTDSIGCVLMVAGGAYKIHIKDIEKSSLYPQSDEDLCPRGHKPASMRIINGAEAVLLYMRKADTFIATNGVCL